MRVLLEDIEEPVSVAADSGDVAEHPLRWGVVRHVVEPLLPVDAVQSRAMGFASAATPMNSPANNSNLVMNRS